MIKSFVLLGAAMCVLIGCKDREHAAADEAAQTMKRSFESAPEELKARYDAVNRAIAESNFLGAKTALDELLRLQPQLSPEQQGAVVEQRQALMLKASTAAQNGDQTAAKVIQDLRLQSRSR